MALIHSVMDHLLVVPIIYHTCDLTVYSLIAFCWLVGGGDQEGQAMLSLRLQQQMPQVGHLEMKI